jgi:hypothetical protein
VVPPFRAIGYNRSIVISLTPVVRYCRAPVVLLLAAAAPAAVVERATLETLTERSEVIAHARCVRTWSAWDDFTGVIWTHSELALYEGFKGRAGTVLRVSEPGGVVGGAGMAVEGVPRFEPGEEVVVFLYRTPLGLLRVRGAGQGKFTVLTNPSTNEKSVRTNVAGLTLVEAARPLGQGISPQGLNGLEFNRFRTLVRGLLDKSLHDKR